MMGKSRHAIEILSLSLPNRNTAFPRQGDQLLSSRPSLLFVDKEFEGLATTAQPLSYRVNPVKIISFHCFTTLPGLFAFPQESFSQQSQGLPRQRSVGQ